MIFVVYLNSNFAMHTDKSYIGEIPIIKPSRLQLDRIISLVDKLTLINDKKSKQFFEAYNKLNNLFYEIYNLTAKDISVIEESLKDVMSRKQNGREDE